MQRNHIVRYGNYITPGITKAMSLWQILAFLLLASLASAQDESSQRELSRAVELHQSGHYTEAITSYRAFLKAHPEADAVRSNLGAALADSGRFDDAIAQYRLALPDVPDKNPIRLNMGLAYYKKGDLSNAREQFAALHQASPANAQAAILLADIVERHPLVAGAAFEEPGERKGPLDLGHKPSACRFRSLNAVPQLRANNRFVDAGACFAVGGSDLAHVDRIAQDGFNRGAAPRPALAVGNT